MAFITKALLRWVGPKRSEPSNWKKAKVGRYIKTGEVAKKLGVCTPTILNWVKWGWFPNPDIPSGGRGCGPHLWEVDTVTDWENSPVGKVITIRKSAVSKRGHRKKRRYARN